MIKTIRFTVILLFIIINYQCTSNQPENIFLITLDTTRADFIDYDLKNNIQTPNLAKIASQGFFFKNAFSVIPITFPSHASMFYSLYPHDLKLLNNGNVNHAKHVSLAQILKKRGFGTYAVISLGVLKSAFGLNRGFNKYIDDFKPFQWTKNAEEVNREAFKLIKKKKGNKNFFWIHYSDPHEPYFPPGMIGSFTLRYGKTFICKTDPHIISSIKKKFVIKPGITTLEFKTSIPQRTKRNPNYIFDYITFKDFKIIFKGKDNLKIEFPASWKNRGKHSMDFYTSEMNSKIILKNYQSRELKAEISFIYTLHEKEESRKELYRSSIKYMDEKFGGLISFIKKEKIFNKSVFIIMGDHGEGLGDYLGHWGHIHYLNGPYSRVPFIVSGFGISTEGERDEVVSNLNIAPTILDLAGLKKPSFMLGESVLKNIEKKRLIIETFSPEAYFDAFSLIDYPYQIIFYPGRKDKRVEFYNFIKNNITPISSKSSKVNIFRKNMLKSILDISRTITATKGKPGSRKRLHKEILRSLGYL